MDEALRALEARPVAAEQQIVERQRQEAALQSQPVEARTVIDRLSAQTTAVPAGPPEAPAPTTGQDGNAPVDTRALGKPPPHSGDATTEGKPESGLAWQQWSFTFRAYAGAFGASRREALDFAARRTDEDQPISNVAMEPRERRLSAQIFYALALTCRGRASSAVQRVPEGGGIEARRQLRIEFEPQLPSRFQGMLQQLLDPARGPDAVENIYAWGQQLNQYEEQSGDTMADAIRLATLNSKPLKGNLRTRLKLQAGRLHTCGAARDEAISHLRATASQEQEPVPMDLSPATVCFYCAKPNRAKQECRALATDRANKGIKPDKAGRRMGKPVDEVTGKRADAEKGNMAALAALSVIVMGDCRALEGDEIDLLFDARAAMSVCPPTWAPEVAVDECRGAALYQAGGNEVVHYVRKEVSMVDQSSGEQPTVNIEAKGVRKPIMAASSAVDAGYGTRLHSGGRYVAKPKHARKNGALVIPARRRSSSGELRAAQEKDEGQKKRARFSDDLEESEGARPTLTKAPAPWPSAEEKARHELTHCPRRAWRRYCLTGQATEGPHESQSKESTVAKLALDCCFLAREGELQETAVLVAKKGVDDVAVEFVLFYLDARGAGEVALRADQGPVIQALLVELRRRQVEHRRAAIEKSTKHDSKANGGIEVVARRVESPTRTCVAVTEDMRKTEATSQSVIPPWLARHSAYIITRFALKSDGRSAWATMQGKEFTSPLAGVGETAGAELIRKDQSKLDPRWASG
ncbi:unnamed protein product, partial [Prorocentrum cordatum]